jgi:hypothetical protein
MATKTKTKGTKLDEFELPILSAIFARSNMGQGLPSKSEVERFKTYVDWRTKKPFAPSFQSCVIAFCGKFMESDEHEDMFMQEAKSWMKELKKDTAEEIARVHPDIAELYWRDPATYVDDKRWPNG